MKSDPDRAQRLAAQLRANLLRRKAGRDAVPATDQPSDPAADQRAKASDPSDAAAPAA